MTGSQTTDLRRWSDPRCLDPAWEGRARFAATMIPAGSVVLDLGCGAMTLERYLPAGCGYMPCDVVRRDDRTIVCDFNRGQFPSRGIATFVSVLGVLEYIQDTRAFLQCLRQYELPVLLTYCAKEFTSHLDRRGLGWVNHYDSAELEGLFRDAGFSVSVRLRLDALQYIFRLVPGVSGRIGEKAVLVLSYNNIGNFGDRLGFHLINEILPAHACVTHAHFRPWDVPQADYDLVIVGIGNSLFAPLLNDELFSLVERSHRVIGIFGTQYRNNIDTAKMSLLIDGLNAWYARYEEDAFLYGRGKNNVHHLGDWLINAFSMARGTRPDVLKIGDEVWNNLPLDRVIQEIQSFSRVLSTRLHPLLCALTSAQQVAYSEQREPGGQESGKFHSMLLDVFGRTWPENQFFEVNRDAVTAYKARTKFRTNGLRQHLSDLLNSGGASSGLTN